jgi:Tol biopolymer transport system component
MNENGGMTEDKAGQGAAAGSVEAQLQRLSESRSFARSQTQIRLLRFLLENAGTEDAPLKETYIGVAFYGRPADYDPREDSIVRVSVNRLRSRLVEYYEEEGAEDGTRFLIPRGSYEVRVETTSPVVLEEAQAVEQPEAPEVASASGTKLWWAVSAACALLLLAGGAAGWKLWKRSQQPWFLTATLESSPVTPGIESEFDPAISPDSETLAYVSRKPGAIHYQLFVRQLGANSESPRVLDTGAGDALHPAWSPDGKTLAFLHCGISGCAFQTVAAAGGPVQLVRELPRFSLINDQLYFEYRQLWPAWMPNGKALIFSFRGLDDDSERLIVHNLASGDELKLTGGDLWDEDGAPVVSPDGKTLAFRRMKISYSELWTVDLATHKQTRIFGPTDPYWSGLTWARDGSGLITAKMSADHSWHLWWLPLSGTPRMLPVAQQAPMTPVLAPNNRTLLMVSTDKLSSLTLLDTTRPGAVPVLNPEAAVGDMAIQFSPDEKRAAILSSSTGKPEIWLADVDVHGLVHRRQITHGLGDGAFSVSWSPDGTLIAVGFPTVRGVLKVVDVETGHISDVSVPGLEKSLILSPVFSPDGKFLFASVSSDVDSGVFRFSLGPFPHTDYVLVHRPYDIAFDGPDTLYLDVRNSNGIERVDLREWTPATGPLARSASKVVAGLADVMAMRSWTIAGQNLYYLDMHDDERRLRCMNLRTGQPSAVTGKLPRISFFNGALGYAPHRQLLVYSQLKNESNAQIMSLGN